jgi:hypothetical protein
VKVKLLKNLLLNEKLVILKTAGAEMIRVITIPTTFNILRSGVK